MAVSPTVAAPQAAEPAALGPRRLFWRRFRRHTPALLSALLLTLFVALVLLAPLIAPYEFDAIDTKQIRKPPSAAHVMGTDELGRDLLTRILYGGRISLAIGFFSALVATLVGLMLGAVAGFYGGWVDNLLMRFTDIVFTIPALPLLILLNSFAKSSVPLMVLVIAALSWMGTARAVRALVLSLKEQEFLLAARALGVRDSGLLARHIIPNTLTPVIVGATLGVGNAIITESSLSFLGLGVTPPTPSWGNMLQDAQSTMSSAPWLTIFPGLAILITVLCVNFLGDGLRDGLDPRLRAGDKM